MGHPAGVFRRPPFPSRFKCLSLTSIWQGLARIPVLAVRAARGWPAPAWPGYIGVVKPRRLSLRIGGWGQDEIHEASYRIGHRAGTGSAVRRAGPKRLRPLSGPRKRLYGGESGVDSRPAGRVGFVRRGARRRIAPWWNWQHAWLWTKRFQVRTLAGQLKYEALGAGRSGSSAVRLDGWPSGLRRTPGERVGAEASRGFESHPVRWVGILGLRDSAVRGFWDCQFAITPYPLPPTWACKGTGPGGSTEPKRSKQTVLRQRRGGRTAMHRTRNAAPARASGFESLPLRF